VHCRAFWPSAVVRLDTWLCTPGEMWETSRRVIERLPPGVRLVSEGPLNGELVGALALVARRRIAPFRPRPADALGTSRAASAGDRLGLRRAPAPAPRLGGPTRRQPRDGLELSTPPSRSRWRRSLVDGGRIAGLLCHEAFYGRVPPHRYQPAPKPGRHSHEGRPSD